MVNFRTYLPAAGNASRLNGLPKYYLPITDNEFLLQYHVNNVNKFLGFPIDIGANKYFYNSVENIFPNTNVTEISSSSMVSTVQKMGLNENQNTLVIMPDTFFSDYEVIKKISMKINKNQYDVVAALWVIRDDQLWP